MHDSPYICRRYGAVSIGHDGPTVQRTNTHELRFPSGECIRLPSSKSNAHRTVNLQNLVSKFEFIRTMTSRFHFNPISDTEPLPILIPRICIRADIVRNNITSSAESTMESVPLPVPLDEPDDVFRHVNAATRNRTPKTLSDNLAKIESLLAQVEKDAELDKDCEDDFVQILRTKDIQIGLGVMRPRATFGKLELVIGIGRKKWRAGSTVDVASITFSYRPEKSVIPRCASCLHIRCDCSGYVKHGSCAHITSLKDIPRVFCRIEGFLANGLPSIKHIEARNEWEVVEFPGLDGDAFKILVVYNRSIYSIHFPITTTVAVDIRPGRMKRVGIQLRVKCMGCRGSALNRCLCIHEINAIEYLSKEDERRQARMEESIRFMNENFMGHESRDETLAAEESDSDSDVVHDESFSKYVSWRPRNFFPCDKETERQKDITFLIRECPDRMDSIPLMDKDGECKGCGKKFDGYELYRDEKCILGLRSVIVHSLHDGSFPWKVVDFICPQCGLKVYFDGRRDAMFVLTRNKIYTRELLDSWIAQVCCMGTTFREAYMSWRYYTTSTSARYSRNYQETNINRRTSLDAFNNFLRLLEFKTDGVLNEFFSCKDCEETMRNGKKRMKCIVIDGTATGILGDLPTFHRETFIVPKYDKHTNKQYILEVAKHRRFIREFLKSARQSYRSDNFQVPINSKDWPMLGFFLNSNTSNNKERVVSSFFRLVSARALPRFQVD